MNIDRYKRSDTYEVVSVNGNLELDFLTSDFREYKFGDDVQKFVVTEEFLKRVDLMSLLVYSQDRLWWVIMKYNNIEDIWNDIKLGDVLQIPSRRDIEEMMVGIRK